jgi:hypothetical protein
VSFNNLVAAILSLFQCHLLFSLFISSKVVWYQISTLVTQWRLKHFNSSGFIKSGRVSTATHITLQLAVSFIFFASSRDFERFNLYPDFSLKSANFSAQKFVSSM